jgi:hypothetical protein
MEKRYVIAERIKKHWWYHLKKGECFDASRERIEIAILVEWYGYKTKQAAKAAYDKRCASREENVNAISILEFVIDNKNRTMRYEEIYKREFESVYD